MDAIHRILDLARWAPSGDNTQPWRFEIVSDLHVVVHGFDTRDHVVYDLDGHPSQISHGALLETMALAATAEGLRAAATRRRDRPETRPVYDVRFSPDAGLPRSPLVDQIERRCVQRRAMSTRPLPHADKSALIDAAGPGHRVVWLETPGQRRAVAGLLFRNAGLRLTMPEAYEVHRAVIEWNARYSDDRLPDQALGADAMTLALMRRVMASWERVDFFNRWLGGTLAPRLQMDLWPALRCAAHVLIVPDRQPETIDDFVAGGRAVQRFWLTATALGLQHQPSMTPLIFGRYVRDGRRFTCVARVTEGARRLAADFRSVTGVEPWEAVWMGRIGAGPAAQARSRRLPLGDLLHATSLTPRSAAAGERRKT